MDWAIADDLMTPNFQSTKCRGLVDASRAVVQIVETIPYIHDCDQVAIETKAFQILRIMDISKASSLGDVGEVEGGLEITLDLPAMKAELTRVQAKCAIRGLAQVHLQN